MTSLLSDDDGDDENENENENNQHVEELMEEDGYVEEVHVISVEEEEKEKVSTSSNSNLETMKDVKNSMNGEEDNDQSIEDIYSIKTLGSSPIIKSFLSPITVSYYYLDYLDYLDNSFSISISNHV